MTHTRARAHKRHTAHGTHDTHDAQVCRPQLSLIIIEGEAVSEFHSHNPRQTLDRYGTSLINDEDHQDPFGGEAGWLVGQSHVPSCS